MQQFELNDANFSTAEAADIYQVMFKDEGRQSESWRDRTESDGGRLRDPHGSVVEPGG